MLNFQIDENFETLSKPFSLFFAKLYGVWLPPYPASPSPTPIQEKWVSQNFLKSEL